MTPGEWSIVGGISVYQIDILAGIGAISVTTVQDALGLAVPAGVGAMSPAAVHKALGAATLGGGGSAGA
jgi:hypothetical protein